MHRNLDARVEVLAPIEDASLKKYLEFILDLYMRDNTHRWILKSNGKYVRIQARKGEEKLSVQHYLMEQTRKAACPVPRSGCIGHSSTHFPTLVSRRWACRRSNNPSA